MMACSAGRYRRVELPSITTIRETLPGTGTVPSMIGPMGAVRHGDDGGAIGRR